mgnify:CR=1 FL=1
MANPVKDLNSPVALDSKGRVIWDEKVDHMSGLPLVGRNVRLHVSEAPEVVEMHGADGWLAFWRASKETGFLPTAPMSF